MLGLPSAVPYRHSEKQQVGFAYSIDMIKK
jgi:hypothetical protein